LEEATEQQSELFDFDPFDTVVGQEAEFDSEDDGDDEDDNLSDLSSEADGEVDDTEDPPEEESTNVQHVQDMVNKLDAILKNVFDHFTHSHKVSTPFFSSLSTPTLSGSATPTSPPLTSHPPPVLENVEEVKALQRAQFFSLLSIFERTILRTFKSRYTQFLLFWFSSLDPEFSDLFQGMLVSKALLEEDQPTVTRAAAASYIASFVSRAVFVERDAARQVVACLCNFLNSRLDIFDAVTRSGANPPSLVHHSIFYAVTQAVFLIFCFRWRDLQQDQEELDELVGAHDAVHNKWMSELEVLKRAVQSDLNPLKVPLTLPKLPHTCLSLFRTDLRTDRRHAIRPRRTCDRFPVLLLHHRV
jgi:RNA polymerase I-specific transcription initiation factor RRN3